MAGGKSKGKGKQSEPSRGHHEPSQKHRRASQKAHAPHENETRFPCKSNHRDCKWRSSGDIECDDGHPRAVSWQKCRKEDARAFLRRYRAPRGGDETQEEAEAEAPPPQTGQAAEPRQAEQAHETQEEVAAGPSSTQAPAAEAAQPVSQQEASTSRANTVPGPFGQPVPAPAAPLTGQHMPFAQRVPGNEGMGYTTGSQSMAGVPGPRNTGYPQNTPFGGGYGGGQNMAPAGGYGGEYDMPFPQDYGEGEHIPFPEDMPFGEDYGEYGEVPMAGEPVGSGGDLGPQSSSTVVAPVEARAKWVATRPENLYHSEEMDGVARDRPYTAFRSVWTATNYSKS
ncbi:hypothetical protein INS49_014107 [Diaporthe citri]|uniref:uncharacterized protein n=1 Tax=Diaporthe citri TaxID=83186 RepID=UPI001C7FCBAF|nr:uncharacterized protein INS49_014107 [Diaporthe citri]KAG6358223.1 hypothetical protein INS49_014107 [Diaporthe citri]